MFLCKWEISKMEAEYIYVSNKASERALVDKYSEVCPNCGNPQFKIKRNCSGIVSIECVSCGWGVSFPPEPPSPR